MSKPIVYIVHGIDVEGPMTETIDATFERMRSYGLPRKVEATNHNLELIQGKNLDLINSDLSENLSIIFNKHSLSYYGKWAEIDSMILECTSDSFREKFCSSDGSPYKFSWFVYDHHDDFTNNPRFHDVGTHKIFDHYMDLLSNKDKEQDGVYWHYHPPSISGDALESNTCWTNHATHETIIARRIIDKEWYSSCFRAGLHIERNDLSHWLEMFIPFDFSGRYSDYKSYEKGSDFDWRGAPSVWGSWHPDWYDYRKRGEMKRHIFRCTDLWTYLNILRDDEVKDAFNQAVENGSSVLHYYNHDYRDMRFEIEQGYDVIRNVAKNFPEVEWKFVTALEAAQLHLGINSKNLNLSYKLEGNLLHVTSDVEIFGPQPFLAIKESGRYFRDNFTQEGVKTWAYKFRKMDKVEAFGIAANSPSGSYDVKIKWMADNNV
jgi:hypothetical protein